MSTVEPVRGAQTGGNAMRILRSVGAVIAGLLIVVVLSTLTDLILEQTIFPALGTPHAGTTLLLAATVYRSLYTIAGGYVTAWLAPRNPVLHGIVLGVIGTGLGALGAIVMWSFGDHWYPIALTVLALPCTWFGAWLLARH